MSPTLFVLALFFVLSGQPHAEAYVAATLEECQRRGALSVVALQGRPRVSHARFSCVSTGPLDRPA
jgi:hypothetical protein